jgi:hypothetical protein
MIDHQGTSLGIMKILARLRNYTLQKPVADADIIIVRSHFPGYSQLVPGYELGSDKDHRDHAWLRSATAQKCKAGQTTISLSPSPIGDGDVNGSELMSALSDSSVAEAPVDQDHLIE